MNLRAPFDGCQIQCGFKVGRHVGHIQFDDGRFVGIKKFDFVSTESEQIKLLIRIGRRHKWADEKLVCNEQLFRNGGGNSPFLKTIGVKKQCQPAFGFLPEMFIFGEIDDGPQKCFGVGLPPSNGQPVFVERFWRVFLAVPQACRFRDRFFPCQGGC